MEDVEFVLLEANDKGDIVKIKYEGSWLIVDNGYLNWSVTVPLLKVTNDQRSYQWIESIRKDVECAFGIIKGFGRILKSGIRLHDVEAVDKI